MTCNMIVRLPHGEGESPILMKPRNVANILDATRTSWVNGMKVFVEKGPENEHVRPLDFLFLTDGSIEVQSPTPTSSDHLPTTYPAAYRIPPEIITDLEPKEKVRRAELFALGSMIYEIDAGQSPFENLPDSDVQARYRSAQFPQVTHLPYWLLILSCWSVEFAAELSVILSKHSHPPSY